MKSMIIQSGKSIKNVCYRVWRFYYEGFSQMTIGKTLWIIILAKLFIFFIVIKLLFFPNLLQKNFNTDNERADHVRKELTERNRR